MTRVAPGDEVVLSWAPSCGECGDCRRGRPAACVPLHRAIGAGTLVDGTHGHVAGRRRPSTAARRQAASRSGRRRRARRAPDGRCGPAPRGGAARVRRIDRGRRGRSSPRGVTAGSTVVVVGAGGVGQFVVQGARIAGATTIVAVDPFADRREQALTLGATHAVSPGRAATSCWPRSRPRAQITRSTPSATRSRPRPRSTPPARAEPASSSASPPSAPVSTSSPGSSCAGRSGSPGTMYGSEDPAVALPLLLEHVRAGRLELALARRADLHARRGERRGRGQPRRRGRPGARPPVGWIRSARLPTCGRPSQASSTRPSRCTTTTSMRLTATHAWLGRIVTTSPRAGGSAQPLTSTQPCSSLSFTISASGCSSSRP